MDIKRNNVFTVQIEDTGEDGTGIGKLDGYIWLTKDAVIGDVVKAEATRMGKFYRFARLMKVVEPSPHRVEPKCPVARQCGGCQLQALSYGEQLKFKEQKAYNSLVRIGKFDSVVHTLDETVDIGAKSAGSCGKPTRFLPIMGVDEPWRCRNKAQFPFGKGRNGEIVIGFYAGRTHDTIENEDYLLGVESNRPIFDKTKSYMKQCGMEPYDEETHRGPVRRALIRVGFRTGEIMVCPVINGIKLPEESMLVDSLKEIEGMTSISYSVNRDKTSVIVGKDIVNLYGPDCVTDYIGNAKYRISPLSFYQVNPVRTEKLYSITLRYTGPTGGETVWDLYCGIGAISLFLVQKAKKTYGVEIVPEAIADVRENAKINGISNAEFYVGKVEEVLPEQYEREGTCVDVIIVDPPRKGCDELCLDIVVKMSPRRVVYVSCDSATLARDLRHLADRGHEVKKVRYCDMFGHSSHVETVVLLNREIKKNDD